MKNLTYEKLQKLLVGKWLRNDGEIERITTRHSLNAIYTSYPFADTPQELIQVGDIIKMKHNDKLQHISKTSDFVGVPLNSITEIHTRTDKDTYKCQWRK